MARPRKDADAPDARTRIIEAFWELIENNSIFELSVGEVTRAAQCNRGTFYYYFHDFDELVAIAIAQLLQDNELITDALWHFSSEGDLSAFDRRDVRCLLRRIVITMRAGAANSWRGIDAEYGRPVSSMTSRARTMRRALCGSMRAADTGSSRVRRSCRPREPNGPAASSSRRARTPGSVPGKSMTSRSAR